jgi:hypothetical protein
MTSPQAKAYGMSYLFAVLAAFNLLVLTPLAFGLAGWVGVAPLALGLVCGWACARSYRISEAP